MVPKRPATGLSLDDLYFNSICAIWHTLHKSLYGQYAYYSVRMEVHLHPVKTASAIEWALYYTAIFWALPLLHVLVVNALMVLKGKPFAYTRLPRFAARARRHWYQKNCYKYQSQILVRCVFFYLIMSYMGGDPSSSRRSIYSTSYVNSSNTRFHKHFFHMPSSMNQIARFCNQTLNTLLLTHTKHQESMSIYDRSKWIWISLYPFIDYGIRTSLQPPCTECTMLTLTIIYGCPIFLSLYETFMHDLIQVGYYGPFRSYTFATCHALRLRLYQTGLCALRVNRWHAVASSIYYTATTILVRRQYITLPSMILLAYVPIIIALLLSLSGDVEVNPGPVPLNITQHATPNANLSGLSNEGPCQSDHVNIMNWIIGTVKGSILNLTSFRSCSKLMMSISLSSLKLNARLEWNATSKYRRSKATHSTFRPTWILPVLDSLYQLD
jgi:hypothetical protein